MTVPPVFLEGGRGKGGVKLGVENERTNELLFDSHRARSIFGKETFVVLLVSNKI